MLDVVLVRHALAYERDESRWQNDDLRPLTPGGIKKFRQAADSLGRVCEPPALVLTSPLVRARQTAQVLAEEARWPQAEDCEPLSPRGAPRTVLELLNEQNVGPIALVGHEPGLSRLAALALAGSTEAISIEVRKGSLLWLRFSSTARAGGATLRWLLPGRFLRAVR